MDNGIKHSKLKDLYISFLIYNEYIAKQKRYILEIRQQVWCVGVNKDLYWRPPTAWEIVLGDITFIKRTKNKLIFSIRL